MDSLHRTKPSWHRLIAVVLGLCLLVVLLHVASLQHAPVAALILAPIVLFGSVAVPQSLLLSFDLDQVPGGLPLSRSDLFQRPPPYSTK